MIEFIKWFLGSILTLVFLYLAFRFSSAAWYNTRRRYDIWYNEHFGNKERKSDV